MAFLNNDENRKVIEIIKSYFINFSQNYTRTLFVNTSDFDSFNDFSSHLKSEIFYNTEVFSFDASSSSIHGSYFPFFDFIKGQVENYPEEKLDNFLKSSKTYYFHRDIFKSYFQNKPIKRYEEITFEELDYEISEMKLSLKNMISEVSKHSKSVVIINGINYLNISSLSFIKELVESPVKGNIFFIFSLNNNFTFDSLEKNIYWDSFYPVLSKKSTVLTLSTDNKPNKENSNIANSNYKNIDHLLLLTHNSLNLLELQESLSFLKKISEILTNNFILLTEEQNILYHSLLGDVYFLIGESELSIQSYNFLIDYYVKENNQTSMAIIYRKLAYVYYRKENLDISGKYISQSLKIFLSTNDSENLFYTYFLLFLVGDRTKSMHDPIQKQYYNILILLGKKLKKYNSLVRIQNIYINTDLPEGGIQEKLTLAEKNIELCKKYGNNYKLSSIYHNIGTLFSVIGDTAKSFEYYKKSEKLKIKIGNKIEIIRIFNGMGYGYFLIENYKKAILYYNKSLVFLKETKDYEETSLTFYNIALTSMFSQNFDSAIEYFEKAIQITTTLKIKEIPFHAIVGIYCLLSYCYLKKGNFIKALEYSNKTKELPYPTKKEDIIFLKLVLALFFLREGNRNDSLILFEDILQLAISHTDLKIFVPFLCFEFVQSFIKTEFSERAKEIAALGLHIAEELKYRFHQKLINDYLEFGVVKTKDFYFKVKSFDLQSMIDFASQHVVVNSLHKRIVEINFLNNLQQLLIQSKKSKSNLINEVFSLIKNNFYTEETFLFFYENNTWSGFYPPTLNGISSHIPLLNILTSSKTEKLITHEEYMVLFNKYSKNPFNSLMSIPLINNDEMFGCILMIIRTSEFIYSEDDLRVLSIAAKQLASTLTNKDLETKLELQNSQLAKTVNKLKSIEKLTSVIYTEKDKRKAINYILTVLTSKIGLNYKCAMYYEYNADTNQLVNRDYFYNFYTFANDDDVMVNIEQINTEIELYDNSIRNSTISLDKNPLIENSFFNGEILSLKNSEYNRALIPGLKLNFFCTLPIIHQENMFGIIVLESFVSEFEITDEEKDILRIFTSNLAIYLENQRLEAERITSEKFETMIKLSSAIVHEVKTPLVGIKGFASIIKRKYSEDAKITNYMDMIIKESGRVDDMASQLLEYSGRTNYRYKLESTNVYELLEEAYNSNKMDLDGNCFNWDTYIDRQLHIKCDRIQMLKALNNIIKNSIEAATGINNYLKVSAFSEFGFVIIEFEDKGVGISPEILPNIFEPLVTTKIQGTGLGLPIVENIIKTHNGQIEITSKNNSGAKVTLKLPMEK